MPRISKKFRDRLLNAVSEEVMRLYDDYCPGIHTEGEPENWNEDTKRIFDLITEAESRINGKLSSILSANVRN